MSADIVGVDGVGGIYGALDWLASLAKIEVMWMGTVSVVYTLSALRTRYGKI